MQWVDSDDFGSTDRDGTMVNNIYKRDNAGDGTRYHDIAVYVYGNASNFDDLYADGSE